MTGVRVLFSNNRCHSGSSRVVLHFSYQYVRSYPSDCVFNSVAINANTDPVSEEALTTSKTPYAFVDGSDFVFTLFFKNMHPPAVLRPDAGHGLILDIYRSHKTTHRIR